LVGGDYIILMNSSRFAQIVEDHSGVLLRMLASKHYAPLLLVERQFYG